MTSTLKFFIRSVALVLFALFIVFTPPPLGITHQAWILFAIFITTIGSILLNLLPIITASIIALSVSVLTGVMDPIHAYSGFSESFILLIVAAFLVSHAVHKSGLGKRLSLHIIRYFGSSTLGLGYSLVATDMLIAPAFPSNTARSGVLYPIAYGLAHDCDSKIADGTRKRAGAYLMMTSMAGLDYLLSSLAHRHGCQSLRSTNCQDHGSSHHFWLMAAGVHCSRLDRFYLYPLFTLPYLSS